MPPITMTKKEKAMLDYLVPFLTDERKALFQEVLQQRTEYATVVLENIFHGQNTSAVLRTSEALGIQDVHIITERYGEYNVNPDVVVGASKWIDIHKYNDSGTAIQSLKAKGYKVVATSPHATKQLSDLEVSQPTAFVFGSEAMGVSDLVLAEADETISIPMFGFTESFNISVSAALCLQDFTTRLRNSEIDWHLSEERRALLYLEWTRQSVKRLDTVEKYFETQIWKEEDA